MCAGEDRKEEEVEERKLEVYSSTCVFSGHDYTAEPLFTNIDNALFKNIYLYIYIAIHRITFTYCFPKAYRI